ncbi:MAG: polyprenyl diphosphate synthase [Minisyncoccales bacterium]
MTNKNPIPIHIGIIPDGNRRWARSRGLSSLKGHEKAAEKERIKKLFSVSKNLGVKYLSLWGFSTENWKRSEKEKDNLFRIFFNLLDELEDFLHKEEIRFRHFGRKDRISKKLANKIKKIEEETKKYDLFNFNICLDYGGRDEIIRAVDNVLKSGKRKMTEEEFQNFLDTKDIPDLDMIIRTSGEKRLSGFMPFQGVYAELFFINKHFPDFSYKDLKKLISDFGKRKRRFGGN